MTNTSLLATLLNLQATKAMAAGNSGTGGYKALVCLFLFGGNDSYNMLAPLSPGEYDDYNTVRGGYDDGTNNPGGLALEESSLLPIDGPNGRTFGIHPGMPEVQELYNNSHPDPKFHHKLAFIANVGSLNRPITRTEYNNNSFEARPLGLFSHADHQKHWMTGLPNTRSQVTGWGGKMSDLLLDTNTNSFVSMNISTNGVNLFQSGDTVVPYTIGQGESGTGDNPATVVTNYDNNSIQNRIFSRNVDSLLGQTYNNLLSQSLANTSRGSIDAAIEFNNAINAVNINTSFDDSSLGRRMRVIAKVIGAQSVLGQSRQVFFISRGGFDNHSGLIGAQANSLPNVSRAIGSFYEAMVELGVENDVTLFTASDFARTLGTNGQGSDHAWGGCQIVCGGCVDGGKIYGDYPLSLLNPTDSYVGNLNLGRGRMIPTTSVDEMAAELAMWFGIGNNQDLETILPQIRQFYDASASGSPLGMFL